MDSRNVYSDSMDIFADDEEKKIKELAIEAIEGNLHYLWGKVKDLEEEIEKLKLRMRSQEDKDYYELNGH